MKFVKLKTANYKHQENCFEKLNYDVLNEIVEYLDIKDKMMLVLVNKLFYNLIWKKCLNIGINKIIFFIRTRIRDQIFFFVNEGERYYNIDILEDLKKEIKKMDNWDYYISFNIYFGEFFILTKIFGSFFVEQKTKREKIKNKDYNYVDTLINGFVDKKTREMYRSESKHYKKKNIKILKEIIDMMNKVIPIGKPIKNKIMPIRTKKTNTNCEEYINYRTEKVKGTNLKLKREDFIIDIQKYEKRILV